MYLFEEYLNRNAIEVNYVKHVSAGSLFYRWRDHWRILQIRFQDGGSHPGYYQVRIFEPINNHREREKYGDTRLEVTLRKIDESNIYWDQYQEFFLNWCSKFKKNDVPINSHDAKIVAWEICVRCFDTLLSAYANNEDFYNTINLDLSSIRRCGYIDRVLNTIRKDERTSVREPLLRFWEADINFMLSHYLDWLAKLVGENCV